MRTIFSRCPCYFPCGFLFLWVKPTNIRNISHSALLKLLWFRLLWFAVLCHLLLWWHKGTLVLFYHPKGGGFIKTGGFVPQKRWLYPPVVLSPPKGGVIPPKSGHKNTQGGFQGGFIPHLGVVLCPEPTVNLYGGVAKCLWMVAKGFWMIPGVFSCLAWGFLTWCSGA